MFDFDLMSQIGVFFVQAKLGDVKINIKQKNEDEIVGEERYYSETDFNNLVNEIATGIDESNLVIFVGAGVSRNQGYPNWDDYVKYLSNYWQFHLHEVATVDVVGEQIGIFDTILESKVTNKRKIDLIHRVIKDAVDDDDDKFNEEKLKFENYYFEGIKPSAPENEILNELVKLDAYFITSNYDFEIERHLDRIKQPYSERGINSLDEFSPDNREFYLNRVLHIHGTTKGNPEYFVNSSSDYSKLYLQENISLNKLKEWFQRKKSVMLFLGSSMEEEEILSLLIPESKSFALMMANKGETPAYRKVVENFFKADHQVTVFWYGDNYKDLPQVIKKIVSAVNEKIEQSKDREDWHKLRSLSTDDQEHRELLKEYKDNIRFLDDVYNTEDDGVAEKLLRNSMSIPNFESSVVRLRSFWKLLTKSQDLLEQNEIDFIIKLFEETDFPIFFTEAFEVYSKLKNNEYIDQEDLDKINNNICKQNDFTYSDFSNDRDLMGDWLLLKLEEHDSSRHSIVFDSDKKSINIRQEQVSKIVSSLDEDFAYRYESFKGLLSTNDINNLIYNTIKNGNFLLDEKDILQNFPEEFLKHLLFQRILVNIDNEKSISKDLVYKLIGKIDFTSKTFGKELNRFTEVHGNDIQQQGFQYLPEYKDGFGPVIVGSVTEKSFIDEKQVMSMDEEELVSFLTVSTNEYVPTSENPFVEKTFNATSDFILSKIKQEDEVSKKLKEIFLDKGEKLLSHYKKVFVEGSIGDEYDDDLSKAFKATYLKNANLDHFTYDDKKFFNYYFKKEGEVDPEIIDCFLRTNVNKLSHKYAFLNEERGEVVEINDFINTEQGLFLDLLIELGKKIGITSEIREIINKIEFEEFKQFVEGALLIEENIDEQIEKITMNTFQGYSYRWRGLDEIVGTKFVLAVKEILKKGQANNGNEHNLFVISVNNIDPTRVEVNWEQINFGRMIEIILHNKRKFAYEEKWLKEILVNGIEGRYVEDILWREKDEVVKEKFEMSLQCIIENAEDYPSLVQIDLLPDYLGKLKGDEEWTGKYMNVLISLLDHKKIRRGFHGSRTFEEIMPFITKKERRQIINHRNLTEILSPLEIDGLKKFLE